MNRNQLTRRAALLVAALFSFSFVSAHGDSVVNSTGDGGLVYGGKYGCETDLLRGGVCTLRAAIEYANLNPDVDTITFGIPTTDPGYNAQTHSWTINVGASNGSPLTDLSTDININGPGAKMLTVQRYSGSAYRIFNVTTNGTVNLSALTIARGYVPDIGGGIQNAGSASVTISKCTIRNNYARTGGAVFNSSAGTLTINNSTLSDNESAEGGAIHNAGKLNISGTTVRHNLAVFQGGGLNNLGDATLTNTTIADNRIICNQGNSFSIVYGGGIFSEGTLSLTNCTVSGNSVRGKDVRQPNDLTTGDARGGGIFSGDTALNIVNSTVSGNSAEGGNFGNGGSALGGGIVYVGQGTLNLSNSTVAGNSAVRGYGYVGGGLPSSFGGGIITASPSIVNVKSTIIANNSAESSPDAYGPFASKGFNLIGKKDGSTGFSGATDKKGTIKSPLDPKLGPLQSNGGPTQTMALLPGSPATDKGTSVGLIGTLTTDQRGTGFPRKIDNLSVANAAGGDGTDIGAFELAAP